MSELLINALNIPPEVRASLLGLSKNIEIEEFDPKATNGFVFFGKNKILKTDVVVKFYYWGGDTVFHAEPRSMTEVHSENVLAVSDAGYAGDDWAYFVSPKCTGGDLDNMVMSPNCSNKGAISITEGILQGLSHLHAARLVHRDIKPANIYEEQGRAVIGDFGSLRKIPEGSSSIPASSHAILYRPPEAIGPNGWFGYVGDVYQAGLVFYQLLGGHLSYEPTYWMSAAEKKSYNKLIDEVDKSLFVDRCIEAKILKGKIIKTLPEWVPSSVKRIINKACNIDPEKRYENTADFLAALHAAKGSIGDWVLLDGELFRNGPTSYRISEIAGELVVEKRRGEAWRRDNSFRDAEDLAEIVNRIEKACMT